MVEALITYLLISAGVATGLALFQFVVLPISGFITEVRQYAEDHKKRVGERVA